MIEKFPFLKGKHFLLLVIPIVAFSTRVFDQAAIKSSEFIRSIKISSKSLSEKVGLTLEKTKEELTFENALDSFDLYSFIDDMHTRGISVDEESIYYFAYIEKALPRLLSMQNLGDLCSVYKVGGPARKKRLSSIHKMVAYDLQRLGIDEYSKDGYLTRRIPGHTEKIITMKCVRYDSMDPDISYGDLVSSYAYEKLWSQNARELIKRREELIIKIAQHLAGDDDDYLPYYEIARTKYKTHLNEIERR